MQLEPPISDWFRSLPYAIDSLANSVKVLDLPSLGELVLLTRPVQFQQATMGSLLKYYREKLHKQRSIIEHFKKERAELVALRGCGK